MDPKPPPNDKKGPAPGTLVCVKCLSPQSSTVKLFACARCGLVVYCSKDCQRAHWKANHKKFCVAKADRAPPPQAAPEPSEAASDERRRAAVRASAVGAGDECAICLDPLTKASACTLPCTHVFHAACVQELRSFGVKQVCPMCRTELPPGPEKLFDEACQRYALIARRVERGDGSWGALSKTEQQETDEVIKLIKEAAKQGYAEAQCFLGVICENGRGVKQDYSEAIKWWRKAADEEYAKAQYNLGIAYYQGQGVKQDYSESANWFHKAADNGHAKAQLNLSLMYSTGEVVKQDYSESIKWSRKAAEQGNAQAQCGLGNAYFFGENGVKQDSSEAFKWWRKAADKGFPNALGMLAQCHEKGVAGLSVDLSKAIMLYRMAANQGFQPAKAALDRLSSSSSFNELIGSHVKLAGLQAKPELNGALGVVVSFNEATGRYAVQLDKDDGQPFMLRPANMKRVQSSTYEERESLPYGSGSWGKCGR